MLPAASPAQDVTAAMAAKPTHLFPVPPATIGQGPAVIAFWMDGRPHRAQLVIETAEGRRVRQFPVRLARGVNRVQWDLRLVPDGVDARELREEGRRLGPLPLAIPGDYRATLTVDGVAQSEVVHVNDDPALRMSRADRAAWTAAQIDLWQVALGADSQHETVEALGAQARMGNYPGLRPIGPKLKKLEAPLEELGEHAETLLKTIVGKREPVTASERRSIDGWKTSLARCRAQLTALQEEIRAAARR